MLRSDIRQELAARIAAVDITSYRHASTDAWTHARLVDLLEPGHAWAHLSYAVAQGPTQATERQASSGTHAATQYVVLVWYEVRELAAADGFTDLDALSDLIEVVTAALIALPTTGMEIMVDGIGQSLPQSTGPISVMQTQIDLTVHHEIDLG